MVAVNFEVYSPSSNSIIDHQGAHRAMADDKQPFWSSIPGILTGIAALLTAATGLIAAFHSHSKSQANAQTTPSTITQPATPASAPQLPADPNGVAGFWSGSAEDLKMGVLNLVGSGSTLHGTFQRPCVSPRIFDIDAASWQGDTLVVTISQLGVDKKTHKPAPPVEFDLQLKTGKLSGTYTRGKHQVPITFASGKQGCPAGADEQESGS
jgi:hypothetical protein